MPVNVVKTRADERLWKRAKAQAAKQGHSGNYPYIMSIFQTMRGNPGASVSPWMQKLRKTYAEIERVLDAVKADLEAENETALLDYFNEQIAHFTDFTAKQIAKTLPPVSSRVGSPQIPIGLKAQPIATEVGEWLLNSYEGTGDFVVQTAWLGGVNEALSNSLVQWALARDISQFLAGDKPVVSFEHQQTAAQLIGGSKGGDYASKAYVHFDNGKRPYQYDPDFIERWLTSVGVGAAGPTQVVRPPFEIQAREIDSYEDFERLYREKWVMVKKYSGQVGAQLALEHMALLADLYPEWEARLEEEDSSPVTAVAPIVPAAPPPVIDPPDSNAVKEAKDNVLEWANQLAALPPPTVEDFMGFSAVTDRPMRTFLGKVGSRPVPLEDWLRASRLLIVHSRTQLPRAEVMGAVRAFEKAVFEKHLDHFKKQRDPDFPILEKGSYEALPDDFNIVDEEEGQAVETGFGTVKWEWGGGDVVEFALPKKMGRMALLRDKLVDEGYIAAIKGYATGGSYGGRAQKVWRLVLHLHGVPALIEMIRKAGGTVAARRLQAALASWVLARPEAMNKPRQRPTEQEKEDRTLRVRKPRNAGGWWNVYWHPKDEPKQEYGWNASQKRWARGKMPSFQLIEKLQRMHPEGNWSAGGGEVIQAGGLRIVVGSPSAKGWYNIVVEGREMDEGDRYGFHTKYGWAKKHKPSYAIQEALNDHDPDTFPIALR